MMSCCPSTPFAGYLTENGQLTGPADIIRDWTSSPGPFFILPPAGKTYHLSRMVIEIEGDPNALFYRTGYGNTATGIVDGNMRLRVSEGTTTTVEWPTPIKRVSDWLAFGGVPLNGPTLTLLQAPFAYYSIDLLAITNGRGVCLRGGKQESLQLFLDGNTDVLGLVKNRAQVFGVEAEA